MLAQRRISKSISQDDLLFIIRHDGPKLKRLHEFLNWKDVRKNVKSSEETNPSNTIPFEVEEEEDEETVEAMSVSASTVTLPKAKPVQPPPTKPTSKKRSYYYWDCLSALVAEATEGTCLDFPPIDNLEALEDPQEEITRRLQEADRLTRSMSKAEYMEFTECRQASFTYKKAKKFRDWLGIPTTVTEYRLSDDVLEILGFLAAECVREITVGALKFSKSDLSESGKDEEQPPVVSLFRPPFQKSAIRPKHISMYLEQNFLYSTH